MAKMASNAEITIGTLVAEVEFATRTEGNTIVVRPECVTLKLKKSGLGEAIVVGSLTFLNTEDER